MSSASARFVLVPGLGLDARSWARVRDRLSATVVHLPGMGRPKPVPSLDELPLTRPADVVDLLRHWPSVRPRTTA